MAVRTRSSAASGATKKKASAVAFALLSVAASLPAPTSAFSLSFDQIQDHILSISDIDEIMTSESSADFGSPLTPAESADLWKDATLWEWNDNIFRTSDEEYESFHSFVICYLEPDLSSMERRDKLAALFEGHEDDVVTADVIYNVKEEQTCYFASARLTALYDAVIMGNATGDAKYLKFQPANPSMKMVGGFVQSIVDRLKVRAEPEFASGAVNTLSKEGERVGVVMTLCPVVLHALTDSEDETTFDDLRDDVEYFITAEEGHIAETYDFFMGLDGRSAISDRMAFWSNAMKNITAGDKFGQHCIDNVIKEQMKLERTMNDTIRAYFPAGGSDATQECGWYIVRAFALHPYICRMELEVRVQAPRQGTRDNSPASPPPLAAGLWGGSMASTAATYLAAAVGIGFGFGLLV